MPSRSVVLVCALCAVLSLKAVPAGALQATVSPSEEAVSYDNGASGPALTHKKTGDASFDLGDRKKAADEYILALSRARSSFSILERLEMATRVSWTGRYAEAEVELRLILAEEPSNTSVRVQLARVLSWAGALDSALEEIEKALASEPENTEALLVKASILRWKGDNAGATAVYEKVLARRDDFDARVGLTYARLGSGKKKEAVESRASIKATNPYQEKELSNLDRALLAAVRPSFDTRYSYYNDTDFNQVRRVFLVYGFWADNIKVDTRYVRTDSHDRFRDNYADSLLAGLSYKASGGRNAGIGAGMGLHRLGNLDSSAFLTMNVKAEDDLLGGRAGVVLSNDLLTDTAALIENGVRMNSYTFYGSRPVTGRLTVYGSASYRHYSDSNSAYDLSLTPLYLISKQGPRLSVGYKFKYLDYDRQSGSGFFDPDNFISNQIFIPASYESGRLYASVEPHLGYQSYKRYSASESGWFTGGSLVAGYRVSGPVAVELNAEGGNSAVGTSAGFKYYTAGLKAVYTP